jgi:hypothetical protein
MNGAITILNKLNRKDSTTNLDVWYKTVINGCVFSTNKVENINGNIVSVGQTFTILIPFSEYYLPYKIWKNSPLIASTFTLNPGDYIFLTENVKENINPNNIQSVRNSYEPYVCEIKTITEVENFGGAKFQFRVEGV